MGDTTREQLGDYELLALIGDGAQGKVFKARRVGAADEFYALKVLRFSGDDDKKVTRFNQSAQTLQKLNHQAIVRYFGSYTWHAGEWDEAHCLVMEYLDGESLDQTIKKNPRGLPWLEVKRIFETCLEGLIYAREQGLIHRDIKPSNIFITHDGRVRLIDFDIARREDGSQSSTAGWKGTFDYMAPDFVQVTNFRGDEQSDIFSLGVCLFQAMTGRLPFPQLGEGAHIGYLTRWRDPAGVKPVLEGGLFRVLVDVRPLVANSLHPSRDGRFKTFQAMLDALRAVTFRTLEHKGGDTYEMTDWLGRGGFGEVYLGRRIRDNLPVAIKRLHSAQYSDRFIREARIVQKYPHDALVKYVDFVEVGAAGGQRQCFLIMEYLEGMPRFSLRNRLLETGRLPAREAVELFIRYLSALQFLHENERPIIHRDIKPANLYAPPGRPQAGRIFDLGIARDVAGTATSGGIPGTLDYMAPEFATAGGDRGTPQTDVFALSLCLYEALTGHVALDKLPTEIGQAWINFQQRAVHPLPIEFTDEVFTRWPTLCDVVRLGLSEDPEHRPSAGELKLMLESVLTSLPESDQADDSHTPASTDTFQRGEDLPTGVVAGDEADDSSGRQTAATAALVQGTPVAEAAEHFVEQKKAERSRSWLMVAAAAALVLAACAWLILQKMKHDEASTARATGTVVAPPVATNVEVPPEPRPEPVFQLDAKFATASASAAYAAAIAAEIARIGKAVENGEWRASAVRTALDTLHRQAAGLPQDFRTAFDLALAAKDYGRAAAVIGEWGAASAHAETMGLAVAQVEARAAEMKAALASRELDDELAALRVSIPANPVAAGAWEQAESAATRLDRAMARDWTGVPPEDRKARLDSVSSALRAVAEVKVSAARSVPELEALQRAAPHLAQRFAPVFSAQAEALLQADKGREQFKAEVDALLAAVPADAASAADLARAEQVASSLRNLPARAFAGVADAEKQAAVSRVKEVLLPSMGATVANLRIAALEKAKTSPTADAALAPLLELDKRYPNATALVAMSHRKALQEVEAAWKSRPPPPVLPPVVMPSTTTVVKVVEKPVVVPPVAATSAPPAVPVAAQKDPNEDEFIRVLLAGGASFVPKGRTGIDATKASDLLAAAVPVRRGFNALDSMLSPKAGQDYLAAIDDLWKKASAFEGTLGARAKDAAWQITHDQLARSAEGTIKGSISARPPSQQARVRREFIKLLSLVDDITGRVSPCVAQDVLRARVSLYFEAGFFNDSLLTERVGNDALLEQQIPWIKEPFDKLRASRGIKRAGT